MKSAVYFRCSTDKQDKSISDQKQVLEKYAYENNFIITTWFDKDEGKSGTSFEKRPDFMRMLHCVESKQNNFKVILVYDIDRWGRPTDPDESSYWEYHFKRYGVKVHYISDEYLNDDSLGGRIQKKIKQELASEESKKQSLRVRERSIMRTQEGFKVGGFAPYGYKRGLFGQDGTFIKELNHGERKNEKSQRVKLIPGDSNQIDVVKNIFQDFANGNSVSEICSNLNRNKIPPPSSYLLNFNIGKSGYWRT